MCGCSFNCEVCRDVPADDFFSSHSVVVTMVMLMDAHVCLILSAQREERERERERERCRYMIDTSRMADL